MLHVFHNRNTGETEVSRNERHSICAMTDLSMWTDVYELRQGEIFWLFKNDRLVRSGSERLV